MASVLDYLSKGIAHFECLGCKTTATKNVGQSRAAYEKAYDNFVNKHSKCPSPR